MRRLARLAPQPPSAVPLGTGGGPAWVGSPGFLTKALHVSVGFSLVGGLGEPPLLVAKAGTLAGSSRSRMDRWTPPGLGARFESTAGSLHIFRPRKDRWGSRPGSRTTTGGSTDQPTMMWTRPTASSSPSRRRVETVWVHLALVLNGLAVGFAELQRGWRPSGSGTRPALVEQVWSCSRRTGRAAALRGAGGEHVRLLLGHHAEAAQA